MKWQYKDKGKYPIGLNKLSQITSIFHCTLGLTHAVTYFYPNTQMFYLAFVEFFFMIIILKDHI
jgi:hypothetical protein